MLWDRLVVVTIIIDQLIGERSCLLRCFLQSNHHGRAFWSPFSLVGISGLLIMAINMIIFIGNKGGVLFLIRIQLLLYLSRHSVVLEYIVCRQPAVLIREIGVSWVMGNKRRRERGRRCCAMQIKLRAVVGDSGE